MPLSGYQWQLPMPLACHLCSELLSSVRHWQCHCNCKKKKKGLCNQRKASKKSSINGAARHKLARVSRKGAAAMAAMVVHGWGSPGSEFSLCSHFFNPPSKASSSVVWSACKVEIPNLPLHQQVLLRRRHATPRHGVDKAEHIRRPPPQPQQKLRCISQC